MDPTKSIDVGKVTKMEDKYFRFIWKIDSFYDYLNNKNINYLQSEDFTTEDESIWYFKLYYEQSGTYNDLTMFKISLDLILKSCKDTLSDVEVQLAIINIYNKKTNEKKRIIECINCNNNVCKFENFVDFYKLDTHMIEFRSDQFTISCEILINSRNQINNIKNNITDDLKVFLHSEKLSDVTLVVDDIKFCVHKAILASRSQVLRVMFESNMIENSENKVIITDIDSKVMKVIILYIYTDKVENLEKKAISILLAAEKYSLEGLKFMCGDVLSNGLTVEEVVQTLVLADTYNVNNLKQKTLNFINKHLTEIVNMKEFNMLQISHSHLIEEILVFFAQKRSI